MIELKITGDALEVKSEIEKLFNMTSGTPAPVVKVQVGGETEERVHIKLDELIIDGKEHTAKFEGDTEAALVEEVPEFDKRGMPWDERIHASSKSINADGTWRNKRGIDKETLEAVEKELLPVEETETVTEPPVTDTVEPPAEVTFKDVQGALVKAISAMKDVKDAKGVPVIGNFSQKLMAKFKVSNINELVNQDDRVEFVDVCNSIISAPDQWETFL